MLNQETEEKAEKAIAVILRYGSMVSAFVMALGVAVAFFRGGTAAMSIDAKPGALLMKAFSLDPLGVIELGILLLLLTPVFRVAVALIGFAVERDHKYALIALGVLVVMLSSIGFALR